MTWIRIHFFERWIQDPDPDPHQNVMDPKHWLLAMISQKLLTKAVTIHDKPKAAD